MEGCDGPAQPSPTIGQCISSGYGWLEVECYRCKTRVSLPPDAIGSSRDTPIWKLETALKCRFCSKGRHASKICKASPRVSPRRHALINPTTRAINWIVGSDF